EELRCCLRDPRARNRRFPDDSISVKQSGNNFADWNCKGVVERSDQSDHSERLASIARFLRYAILFWFDLFGCCADESNRTRHFITCITNRFADILDEKIDEFAFILLQLAAKGLQQP